MPDQAVSLRAARAFAAMVSRVDAVSAVAVVPAEEGLSVWTLLHGDPHGSARKAVYRLELVTQQEHPGALLDFRVINASDFPKARRDELLPFLAQRLYVQPSENSRPTDNVSPQEAPVTLEHA